MTGAGLRGQEETQSHRRDGIHGGAAFTLASDEHDWSVGDEEGDVQGEMGKRHQVRARGVAMEVAGATQ